MGVNDPQPRRVTGDPAILAELVEVVGSAAVYNDLSVDNDLVVGGDLTVEGAIHATDINKADGGISIESGLLILHTTAGDILLTATAFVTVTAGADVDISAPAGSAQVVAQGTTIVQSTADDVDITAAANVNVNAGAVIDLHANTISLFDGVGLDTGDRPVIAAQVAVVDPVAFNALRTALVALGVVVDPV